MGRAFDGGGQGLTVGRQAGGVKVGGIAQWDNPWVIPHCCKGEQLADVAFRLLRMTGLSAINHVNNLTVLLAILCAKPEG
jgi:hypothetical protein